MENIDIGLFTVVATVVVFFCGMGWQLKGLSSAIKELRDTVKDGQAISSREHKALMDYVEKKTDQLKQEIEKSEERHVLAHDKMGEKLTQVLAENTAAARSKTT